MFEKVCVVTHTTWIFKREKTSFCSLPLHVLSCSAPLPTSLNMLLLHAEVLINIAQFKWEISKLLSIAKKKQSKIAKHTLLSSQTHTGDIASHFSALHTQTGLPLWSKRHPIWAGDRELWAELSWGGQTSTHRQAGSRGSRESQTGELGSASKGQNCGRCT